MSTLHPDSSAVLKKVQALFSTLPEPWRDQALRNLSPFRLPDHAGISLHNALLHAFEWQGSPEGWDYWNNLAENLPEPEPSRRQRFPGPFEALSRLLDDHRHNQTIRPTDDRAATIAALESFMEEVFGEIPVSTDQGVE